MRDRGRGIGASSAAWRLSRCFVSPPGKQGRAQLGGHVAPGGKRLQDEHGVGDRHVLEVLVPRLERLEHRLDRDRVAEDVARRGERERVADVVREVVVDPDRVGVDAGLCVPAEDEQRERGRVAADRGLGFGGSAVERPSGRLFGPGPVVREHERLDRADRPAPAARRGLREALAVAIGRAHEPLGSLGAPAFHQEREGGPARRVPHPGQLALAALRIGRVVGSGLRQPRLAVAVASLLACEVCGPILVRGGGFWFRHSRPPPRRDRIEQLRMEG